MKILYTLSYDSVEKSDTVVFVEENFWNKHHHLADSGITFKAITKVLKHLGNTEIEESVIKLNMSVTEMIDKMDKFGFDMVYSEELDHFINKNRGDE